jgi:serine/threonine protein kinase
VRETLDSDIHFLPNTMNSNAQASLTDSTLTRRVAELVERLQAGEQVDLKAFCSDSPEQFEQLEMLLPTLQAVVDLEHSLPHVGESLRSKIRRGEDSQGATAGQRSAVADWAPPEGRSSSAQVDAAATRLLGDFRILRELGRGGMGVVYEAEQISLGRRVALKVLPFAAMLDRQQLARFKNEARAAATLDHPNIVAIYSVGAERGVHYYAMQLIEGQSLAEVIAAMRQRSGVEEQRSSGVEEQRSSGAAEQIRSGVRHHISSYSTTPPLHSSSSENYSTTALPKATPPLHSSSGDTTPVARLTTLPAFDSREYFRAVAQLGIQAAEALDHAHQNGILHRDIKPANLLVESTFQTPSPLAGTPKTPSPLGGGLGRGSDEASHLKLWITDFGLARMEQDAGMTMTGDLLGTLRYMSPEQALAKRAVVDHRSDIYSLGVTLYELLTLQPAFTGDDRQELLRQIAFDEPRLPRQMNARIPQDLETIVLKAIRKDPEHRYATAQDLANDLKRFVNDQPIKAKPPTWREQLMKWSRRHPAAIWAAVLVLLATTLISAASAILITSAYKREAVQRQQASIETAKAKAVSDLLQEMLSSADAARAKGADYKVRELLDDFVAGLHSQLTDQREVEADIRATIGRAYRSLNLPEKAQPHFERAIELYQQTGGPQSEKLAAILVDGAWNLQDQWRFAEAESQVNEALAIYRKRGVTGGPLFHALEILQHILRGSAGREKDAERVTEKALAVARQSGEEFPDQANLLHRYADLKFDQGKFVEAEQLARQSVDMHYRLHGDRHPETAFGLKTLARALESQQKLKDAESAIREALAVFRHQFPEDHPNVRDTMNQLRSVLKAREDKTGLEALAKEEAEIEMRSGSPGYHLRVAGLLLKNKPTSDQKDEARRLIRRFIEVYSQAPIDHPDDFRTRMNAADGFVLAIQTCVSVAGFSDEIDEMILRLQSELPQVAADFRDSNQCQWEVAMCYLGLGRMLFDHSNYQSTTEHAYHESIDFLMKYSLSDPNRPYLWIWLGESYVCLSEIQWQSGRPVEAEATIKLAAEIYNKHAAKIAEDIIVPPYPGIYSEIISYLLGCARSLAPNEKEEAAKLIRNAALITKHMTDPAELANALHWIALTQLQVGDQAAYRATCRALVDLPLQNADDVARSRPIWTPCLAPDALDRDDVNLLVKRAEEFVAHNSLGQPQFGLNYLGAALYRSGRFERAAQILEESIAAYPGDPPPGFDIINIQRLLLAMTKWRLGKHDEASQLLAETLPAIEKELQSPSSAWNRLATLELLSAEANALIGPKDANEAVENKEKRSRGAVE